MLRISQTPVVGIWRRSKIRKRIVMSSLWKKNTFYYIVFCWILQKHINGKKIDFTNCYFDLGYLICSDDCHPFFQDRNHSQSIESSPALWIANDKASFSWADVMIMSHIKYNSRRPSSTVGNPVANSHPCMLLGRINSWPCKKS